MPILLAALALLAAVTFGILYVRGDRRRDLRRCPRCRYDMADVPAMTCPECGYAGAGNSAFHYTRRRRIFAACCAVCLLAAIGAFVGGAIRRGGIIPMLPHPVLAWLLERATPVPPTAPGGDVPAATLPNGVTAYFLPHDSPWKRLSWNQQYVYAIRAWGDLVASDDPAAFADMARIHAALAEMTTWRRYHDSTAFVDSWIVLNEYDRQAARMASKPPVIVPAPGGAVPLDRIALFMLAVLPPRNECEGVGLRGAAYTPAPQQYLAAMARCSKSAAQVFAMERLGPEPPVAEVDIDALLGDVEKNGVDQKARDAATTIRGWRKEYMNRFNTNR